MKAAALTVLITTLVPEPFELTRERKATVQPVGDEQVASFFDATRNASGSTELDAVANLKDVTLSVFEFLSAQPKDQLGLGPARPRAVLHGLIRRRS
jgi:hypothetical protein